MSFHVQRHTSQFQNAPRAVRACELCHTRKVRCDISLTRRQCSNCQRDGQVCEPRARQRRTQLHRINAATSQSTLQRAKTREGPVKITTETTATTEPASPPSKPHEHYLREQDALSHTFWAGPVSVDDMARPPDPYPAASISSIPSSYDGGYMERSVYIAPDKFRKEDGSAIKYHTPLPSEATRKLADLQKAFEMPPRAIRESLFENFWKYCYAWDPIVDRSQLESLGWEKTSPLLLQSIFLAGSRMLPPLQTHAYASSQDYYVRAKTLFWLDCEQDPLNLLIAASLMHWWNPHGPERVSTNTSSFWCRITVSLAQQMGLHRLQKPVPNESLRRRLWWSIVARDCLISLAHGRPQAITLEECDVPLPTLTDFPNSPHGMFFIAYVELSLIVGRLIRHETRKPYSKDLRCDIENSLYRWAKTLPDTLRLSSSKSHRQSESQRTSRSYNLESRQLHVLYLVIIIILYRLKTLQGPFPTAAVMAASAIGGVFEDFLARDEVRLLGPCFTFHVLAASITLLSCHKYPKLWALAQEDLKTLAQAQDEMKKKWPSALGSIGTFDRMYKLATTMQQRVVELPKSTLTTGQAGFFEDCDVTLCRMHDMLVLGAQDSSGEGIRDNNGDVHEQSHATTHVSRRGYENVINGNGSGNGMSYEHPNESVGANGHVHLYNEVALISPHNNQAVATLGQPSLPEHGVPDESVNFDQMFQEEAGQLNGALGDWLFWDQLAFDTV